MLRFHAPPHQTGRADFPHPAFGQGLMCSPTGHCDLTSVAGRGPTVDASIRQGIVNILDLASCACDTTIDEAFLGHGY